MIDCNHVSCLRRDTYYNTRKVYLVLVHYININSTVPASAVGALVLVFVWRQHNNLTHVLVVLREQLSTACINLYSGVYHVPEIYDDTTPPRFAFGASYTLRLLHLL